MEKVKDAVMICTPLTKIKRSEKGCLLGTAASIMLILPLGGCAGHGSSTPECTPLEQRLIAREKVGMQQLAASCTPDAGGTDSPSGKHTP
jgi:hypothetical protein